MSRWVNNALESDEIWNALWSATGGPDFCNNPKDHTGHTFEPKVVFAGALFP